MLEKDSELKSHKAVSLDEKEIRSSQHSKIKKSMADQLRLEIRLLIQKQEEADSETWKSHARFKKFQSVGD